MTGPVPRPVILYVVGKTGVPVEHALPRAAARGRVVALVLNQPSPVVRGLLRRYCEAVIDYAKPPQDATFASDLADLARLHDATVLLNFDELSVEAVAAAASACGLRGAGPSAALARDKWLMRCAFARAGVPNPNFELVESEADLAAAGCSIGFPLLLKAACGVGSIGHTIVRGPEEIPGAWAAAGALHGLLSDGEIAYAADKFKGRFIAESIIAADGFSWFGDRRYGDYLSVEGLVVGGEYHPIAITTRLPTIPPFTEMGNQAPCALPRALQDTIVAAARRAVDAQRLEFCGTHTEIKLLPDRSVCLLESAARFSGGPILDQLVETLRVDLVDMLLDALIGGDVQSEKAGFVYGSELHCGCVVVIGANAAGRPWREPLPLRHDLDWEALAGGGRVQTRLVLSKTVADGDSVQPYDPRLGLQNVAGLLLLKAASAEDLLTASYNILDGLERRLSA